MIYNTRLTIGDDDNMIYNIRLTIADGDNYDGSLRFDDSALDSTQKQSLATAIDGLKTNFDAIRDVVI